MMRLFLIIIFAALITSCGMMPSGGQYKAAQKAAAAVGAESFTVGNSSSAGTDGSYNDINLTLKKVSSIDNGYPPELVASLVSLVFFDEMSKEDLKDADRIVIEFEGGTVNYEHAFTISEVEKAVELTKTVTQFFEHVKAKNYQRIGELMDTTVLPAESIPALGNLMHKTDSAYGKMSEYSLNGFVYEEDESTDKPGIRIWAESMNGTIRTDYKFYVLEENKKIGNVALNAYDEAAQDSTK